jgi:hypothetical protein
MPNMSSWMRGIVQNLVSNTIWAAILLVLGALAVWLASLTPIIKLFAPLSYLLVVMLVGLLALIVGYVGIRIRRQFVPLAAQSDNGAQFSERLKRVEERLDGATVSAGALNTKRQDGSVVRLTDAEKERVAKALHAVADYLAGKFETLIEPLREVMKWEWILEHVGTGALQSVAEQGRVISREIPAKLLAATKPYEFELGLVGIEPMLIKTKTVEFDNILHGVASVAANLKEPNIASARLSCEAFAREFQVFQDELERVKNQIGETRRKLANGELG